MSEADQPTLFDQPDPELPDRLARARVADDLDTTLFVEAGAGSGKTRSLVDRIESLLAGGTPMRHIAAITFTERAAAELRQRIRARVIDRLDRSDGDPSPLWSAARDDLDGAAVSTLHAFAQRLLGEHPIEAGLPPNVEVLDEISSQIEFDARWRTMVDRLFDDPDLTRTLELSLALGVTTEQLRAVALEFTSNWDLIQTHPPGSTAEPPRVRVEPLLDALRALVAPRSSCLADRDGMTDKLDKMQTLIDRLDRAADDASIIELLDPKRLPSFKSRVGAKGNWPDGVLDHLRTDLFPTAERVVEQTVEPVREACLQRLVHHLGRFVVEDAERRRTEGRLRFHDLLVHARRLLADPRHGPTVRASLSDRYQRLLLDEFQDTDPLQIELATLLAAPPDQPAAPWHEMDTRPGRLFFVGDPKQSIYRFRRADIALYLAAQQQHQGEDPVELSRNFRSTEPILDWVNDTFGGLISYVAGSQPPYRPLQAVREAPPSGPGVVVLDAEHDGLNAAALREEEAASVAATIRTALDDGWSVFDTSQERWRPTRPGDICVLLPARTSLPQLEAALTAAEVPFRVETSTLVYAAEDVRSLMACLRALADPGDSLSLVTALRSPAFGCGDDDLFTWHQRHGGRWDHRAPAPDGTPPDHAVAESMAYLRGLAADSRWLTPPQVIDRLIHDRRLLESAAFAPHTTDRWRQLRFVADQARAWADTHGGDLRDYLAWARLQASDSARVAEPVLDETDAAAVRIMTIHASKGLEFPIAVLSGLTTRLSGARRGPSVLFPPDGPAQVKLKADVATQDFERLQPVDEQMDRFERIRLLYVGCTRARDHLVVSCHRLADPKGTAAELLWSEGSAGAIATRGAPAETPSPDDHDAPTRAGLRSVLTASGSATGTTTHPARTRTEFEAQRRDTLRRAAAPASLSATAVARRLGTPEPSPDDQPGWFKDPVDVDLPPWQRGRDGAALGRAVHATLQDVDLASGTDLADLARHHAAAEGIPGDHDQVHDRALAALSAPSVSEARSGEFWREIYVAAPAGTQLVEGYIDLLYRTPDGFVVVDYKTDAAAGDAHRRRRAAAYRWQLATYAHAVEVATGIPVLRAVVCFLDSGGAHEVEVEDLRAAMAEIGRLADPA